MDRNNSRRSSLGSTSSDIDPIAAALEGFESPESDDDAADDEAAGSPSLASPEAGGSHNTSGAPSFVRSQGQQAASGTQPSEKGRTATGYDSDSSDDRDEQGIRIPGQGASRPPAVAPPLR